jgi:hypothetical protein
MKGTFLVKFIAMLKYLLILVNSLALFLFGLFNGGNRVTLTHNIPSTIAAGHETNIEIVILKGEVNGFARLEMEIPDGISVTKVEDKGAKFSFQHGVARWIWSDVPDAERLIVKMVWVASEQFPGVEPVTGKYCYVENNQRQVVQMAPAVIGKLVPEAEAVGIPTLSIVHFPLSAMEEPFGLGDNGVSITHNIPPTIEAGQEIKVELKVRKGEMNGFAKLQLEIPEGITIKESEDLGASYSFEEGVAKWIWAAVPNSEEMVIRLSLLASEESLGLKTFNAKFSFVEDNAKQVVEMKPAEVNVVGPSSIASARITPNVPDSTLHTAGNGIEPDGNIVVTRKVNTNTPGEILVTLNIEKGNTGGFAKYSDNLPGDMVATSVQTDGASFSVSDGRVRFVWVTVPDKNMLKVSYILSGKSNQPLMLDGEYSYLERNQSKKYVLQPETVNLPQESFAGEAGAERSQTEAVEAPVQSANNSQLTNTNQNPSARSNPAVIYYVQIGAFSKIKATPKRLSKKFNVKEKISSEMQGGFSKFMVGKHSDYKDGRDHREKMITEHGIKSAFVVAYNHGKRITVQEALMVTSQKWFK